VSAQERNIFVGERIELLREVVDVKHDAVPFVVVAAAPRGDRFDL
jgi:hypothetical protein